MTSTKRLVVAGGLFGSALMVLIYPSAGPSEYNGTLLKGYYYMPLWDYTTGYRDAINWTKLGAQLAVLWLAVGGRLMWPTEDEAKPKATPAVA